MAADRKDKPPLPFGFFCVLLTGQQRSEVSPLFFLMLLAPHMLPQTAGAQANPVFSRGVAARVAVAGSPARGRFLLTCWRQAANTKVFNLHVGLGGGTDREAC